MRGFAACRILQANPALVRMLGYDSEAELCKLDMTRDVYQDPKQRQRLIAEHWQKDEFHNVEVQWKRRDGKFITAMLNGRRVTGHALAYSEVFAEDITERRVLERQLLYSIPKDGSHRPAGWRSCARLQQSSWSCFRPHRDSRGIREPRFPAPQKHRSHSKRDAARLRPHHAASGFQPQAGRRTQDS